MHGDVSNDAVEGRAHGVVAQRLPAHIACLQSGLVIGFGVVVGLLRLVERIAAGDARFEELLLAVQLDVVVVVEGLFLPLGCGLRLNVRLLLTRIDGHQDLPGLDMLAAMHKDLRQTVR